ncbi:hypothetical protein NECAME_12996, partial [Necator americanus]
GVLAFENDYVVPRNLALYDVIAGLEFIHNEVAAFGGNPSQVTIMGHSQGGSTAMVLAVSSLVDPDKRLFQQLVAFSPALNYRDIKGRADLTWRLAHEVGVNKDGDDERVKIDKGSFQFQEKILSGNAPTQQNALILCPYWRQNDLSIVCDLSTPSIC